MVSAKHSQELVDLRGRAVIERRGIKRASLANDAYHFLRTASWTRIILLFAGFFLLANLVFASVLYFGGAEVANARGFLDMYWFSVQTMATIGYGYLAPMDHLANVIVTVEAFFGIMLTALITGLVFARFSTPSARVIFSKVGLITDHDGQKSFMFRMANERATAIVEATVRAYLIRDDKLANGETFRRVYDLVLRRATSPVFALSFTVVHPIDPQSPLAAMTARDLRESNTNVVVTFTGIDDRLAATVHSRYLWTWNDILYDEKFVDLFRVDDGGKRYLDLEKFHDTEPA
ncbi:MAG: ion channel [Acidobacteriota bacterium]